MELLSSGGNLLVDFHTGQYYVRRTHCRSSRLRSAEFLFLLCQGWGNSSYGAAAAVCAEAADTARWRFIYPGCDGKYELYEDAGDDYEYENGQYNLIAMYWDDEKESWQ